MFCGVYSGLVRPGNGVGANKRILGGLYTDTDRCSTRMPLSVLFFALCLHPLVRALEDIVPNIMIGRQMPHGPVIAYADDVTVFVQYTYEQSTGACLNPR
jgi:hypothetical protein